MPKSILFVDDNPDLIEVVCIRLNKIGYHTVIVNSAEEAFVVLEGRGFDLIFMDLLLPKMDGAEACKKIRLHEKHKNTPVVLLTSSTEHIKETASSMGANDYLSKPFAIRELMEKVEKFTA